MDFFAMVHLGGSFSLPGTDRALERAGASWPKDRLFVASAHTITHTHTILHDPAA